MERRKRGGMRGAGRAWRGEKRETRERQRERERETERECVRVRKNKRKGEKNGTHKKREGINCGWRERNRIKTLEKERPTPSRTTYGEVP